ncbi:MULTISPECIES: hypothetical protein [Natrialba]|uniref:Uncharacterized protein n=1 Tax=Natrialba swarupiae TaxID=2448032 RepID=A0A5D5AGB4_9EURY|nr:MULTISPECIES: hypothetical protein [Natrialba]MWV38326.1 hypothetical protein [Natrialba sp. INN-245]TYT60839.1 hypothetical protein FYC77_16550 [Natrialba swarupiae]
MSDVSSLNDDDVMDRSERGTVPEGTATIECYEIDDGVVFYDAENPLAWVETSQTLTLADLA